MNKNYTVFSSVYDYDKWFEKMTKKLRCAPYTFRIINNEVLKVYNDKTKNFDNYIGIYWEME